MCISPQFKKFVLRSQYFTKYSLKSFPFRAESWWLTPVILDIQEAEVRRIVV
jgi:hypothetical protein